MCGEELLMKQRFHPSSCIFKLCKSKTIKCTFRSMYLKKLCPLLFVCLVACGEWETRRRARGQKTSIWKVSQSTQEEVFEKHFKRDPH